VSFPVPTDRDASGPRVIASRKDWVLELPSYRLCITLLGVEASVVSSHSLLDTVGSAPGNVGDFSSRRCRQSQAPERLRIGNVDAVKGTNVIGVLSSSFPLLLPASGCVTLVTGVDGAWSRSPGWRRPVSDSSGKNREALQRSAAQVAVCDSSASAIFQADACAALSDQIHDGISRFMLQYRS
jgi:hypothetical protein